MNEIIQSKISDHGRSKLEISNRKITGKISKYLRIKQYIP